VVEGAVIRQKK